MNDDEDILKKFASITVDRLNDLNARLTFLEIQFTKVVNAVAKTNIKYYADGDNDDR